MAADGAALAGARVLANSGMTSKTSDTTLAASARNMAITIAHQIGTNNLVGGRPLTAPEVNVTFPRAGDPSFPTNPRVTVQVTRTDLPTFFAHIWGRATLTVTAFATAEAYNPSGADALGSAPVSIAVTCAKPWVLPNLNPNDPSGTAPIISRTTGAIDTTYQTLIDEDLITGPPSPALLQSLCKGGNCNVSALGAPQPWQFYPGAQSSFPAPSNVPSCPGGNNTFQNSVIGCVQTPISCGSTVNLESTHGNLPSDTNNAVNCLTHATNNAGDSIDSSVGPHAASAFQFLTGGDNPLVVAGSIQSGKDVLVSSSIVNVPIYDSTPGVSPTSPVSVNLFVVGSNISATGEASPGGSGRTNPPATSTVPSLSRVAVCHVCFECIEPVCENPCAGSKSSADLS